MREIKFRAWSGSKKAMYRVLGYSDKEQCFFVQGKGRGKAPLADIVLMQYTGLKDRNGTEIYEGDIVPWLECFDYEVVWDDTNAWYAISDGENSTMLGPHLDYVEVIGNIYENPELLEDTK